MFHGISDRKSHGFLPSHRADSGSFAVSSFSVSPLEGDGAIPGIGERFGANDCKRCFLLFPRNFYAACEAQQLHAALYR